MVNVDALLECAIQKLHNPMEDLVSRTALGREFGRVWVEKKASSGLITAQRNGKKNTILTIASDGGARGRTIL